MHSRRSQIPQRSRAVSEMAVLEVRQEGTRPLHLSPGHPLIVGHDERGQVTIVAGDHGKVEVRASGGAAVRINDVQVHGVAHARAGDFIALPDRSFLVQLLSRPLLARPILSSHESFEQRLNEEVTRAEVTGRPVSVLIVRSRALLGAGIADFLASPEIQALHERGASVIVGWAAASTLELLFSGVTPVEADEVREQLSEALGRLGRPFRWGWANTPTDALHPATLWGRALDRLLADQVESVEDLPHVDPVMIRLWSLCDVWAATKGGVLLQAEVGSGRETLARVIHERRTPQAPFVIVRSATFESLQWRESVARAAGGSLFVRNLGCLPPSERASFWQATSFRPMAGAQEHESQDAPTVVTVPALRDRSLDVLPIAEHLLARCSGFDGSPKLTVTPSLRQVLSRDWAGSVRELKNSLQLAALSVDASGDVLPEHVTSALTGQRGVGPRETDVRASLRSLERRSFLEALGRTNWNVTEAARVLGLPRRTVVYRMSRLGLKRPL